MLENNGGSLYSQIALLDPSFYSCTHFNDVEFFAAESVGQLLKVSDLGRELRETMKVSRANKQIRLPGIHDSFVDTLASYNAAINDLCRFSQGHLSRRIESRTHP